MAKHIKDKNSNNLHTMPSGNPYAYAQEETETSLLKEPTEAQKHEHLKKLQNPPAHIEIFGDIDAEDLTEEWVLNTLSSYLPKASQARDRKAVSQIVSEFVADANVLSLEQKRLIKHKLLIMKPEGGLQMEAARTTRDTIKEALQKLLNDVKKQS